MTKLKKTTPLISLCDNKADFFKNVLALFLVEEKKEEISALY
jgi:hypothetical protein